MDLLSDERQPMGALADPAGACARDGRHRQAFRLRPGCALPDRLHGSVVAIGNFDGVHLAHQRLMEHAKAAAARLTTSVMALTFDPHPRIFFNRTQGWFELTPLRDKITLLQNRGVAVSVLEFDAQTASMTACRFIESVLVDGLGAACVVVGDDFKCGKDQVSADGLVRIAERYRLPVEIMPPVVGHHGRVSSTAIRAAITAGDLDRAVSMLAR